MGAPGWDEAYRAGNWQYLASLSEMGRYALIAGYLRHFVPAGRVVDVGCGEGLLVRQLGPHDRYDYTGIDLSQVVLDKAAARHPERSWIASSADQFVAPPAARFDAIVFNEVLYYLDDPAVTLRRYLEMLNAGGVVMASMFVPAPENADWVARVARAWQAFEPATWSCLDLCDVHNARARITWRVGVFERAAPNPVASTTTIAAG